MILRCFALAFCNIVFLIGKAQTADQLDANKQRVVHITLKSNGEKGSGFIVGTNNGIAYVVTANHVIARREKTDTSDIEVTIENKSYPGIPIVETDSGSLNLHSDIALIQVVVPKLKFKPCVVVEDPDNCEDFFFIRTGDNKFKLPEKTYGTFEYWEGYSTHAYIIYLKEIEPGDSGSALFEKDAIAGMIVSKRDSRSTVLSMKRIDEVLSKFLPPICRFKFTKRLIEQ